MEIFKNLFSPAKTKNIDSIDRSGKVLKRTYVIDTPPALAVNNIHINIFRLIRRCYCGYSVNYRPILTLANTDTIATFARCPGFVSTYLLQLIRPRTDGRKYILFRRHDTRDTCWHEGPTVTVYTVRGASSP